MTVCVARTINVQIDRRLSMSVCVQTKLSPRRAEILCMHLHHRRITRVSENKSRRSLRLGQAQVEHD